jgi:hypothetical protein
VPLKLFKGLCASCTGQKKGYVKTVLWQNSGAAQAVKKRPEYIINSSCMDRIQLLLKLYDICTVGDSQAAHGENTGVAEDVRAEYRCCSSCTGAEYRCCSSCTRTEYRYCSSCTQAKYFVLRLYFINGNEQV